MALEVGKKAPAFNLQAAGGAKVALKDLAGKWVVLYFYPKDDTPGCTVEAQDFRDRAAELKRRGAAVFGVSKDSIESHCKFRDKYELNFELLSDPDGKVLEKYGAWGEKNMYGKKSMGVIRSTVLIGPDGKVRKVWPRVRVQGHADDVLRALDAARQGE
jgi:thioredoxin-dependent peroxiredoxin